MNQPSAGDPLTNEAASTPPSVRDVDVASLDSTDLTRYKDDQSPRG
ncbi:hypothetical protein AB0B39_03770 [Micromonospora sp. NPDC049114]